MTADAIYVVITPSGHISDSAAYDMGLATRSYVRKWMPEPVSVSDYIADQLWREFAKSGYKVERVDLPDNLTGKPVCRT